MTTRYFTFTLIAASTLALAGCVNSPEAMSLAEQPSFARMQAFRGIWPEFVYYPDYEVYYSRNYGLYVFCYNYGWGTETYPPDLPEGTLDRARVVQLDAHFSDPIGHHREISLQYPRRQGSDGVAATSSP